MDFEHIRTDALTGTFVLTVVVGLLVLCFCIGFAVTCGVWKADAFMDWLDHRREARMGLRTVDDDYERLCEE